MNNGYSELHPSTDVVETAETAETIQVNSLAILDQKEASLLQLAGQYKGLTINGIDDKEGYKLVREARITVKNARVQIQKDSKALRENAVKFQKRVIDRGQELIAIIAPVEVALQAEEARIEIEKEQIRLRKEREENQRIQDRINTLARYGYAIDLYDAKIMHEENFQALLGQAQAEWEKQQQIVAELKAEQEKKKKEEAERIQREREELAKLRAEQEARERELKRIEAERIEASRVESERLRKEREEHETQMRIEREKIEAEKRAFALEKEKAEAQERARIEAEERIKREAEEKAEFERLAKLEAERQEALRPDKEKLIAFAKSLLQIEVPKDLQSRGATALTNEVSLSLERLSNWIIRTSEQL